MVVEDNKKDNAKEIILTNDPVIKYVHDVSRFSCICENDFDKEKVFVFALRRWYQMMQSFKCIIKKTSRYSNYKAQMLK